jgi:hypothetical protein
MNSSTTAQKNAMNLTRNLESFTNDLTDILTAVGTTQTPSPHTI